MNEPLTVVQAADLRLQRHLPVHGGQSALGVVDAPCAQRQVLLRGDQAAGIGGVAAGGELDGTIANGFALDVVQTDRVHLQQACACMAYQTADVAQCPGIQREVLCVGRDSAAGVVQTTQCVDAGRSHACAGLLNGSLVVDKLTHLNVQLLSADLAFAVVQVLCVLAVGGDAELARCAQLGLPGVDVAAAGVQAHIACGGASLAACQIQA